MREVTFADILLASVTFKVMANFKDSVWGREYWIWILDVYASLSLLVLPLEFLRNQTKIKAIFFPQTLSH